MVATAAWRRPELREADMTRRGWGARGAAVIRTDPTSDPQ